MTWKCWHEMKFYGLKCLYMTLSPAFICSVTGFEETRQAASPHKFRLLWLVMLMWLYPSHMLNHTNILYSPFLFFFSFFFPYPSCHFYTSSYRLRSDPVFLFSVIIVFTVFFFFGLTFLQFCSKLYIPSIFNPQILLWYKFRKLNYAFCLAYDQSKIYKHKHRHKHRHDYRYEHKYDIVI